MQTLNQCVCGFVNSHTSERCARCEKELICHETPPPVRTELLASYGDTPGQKFEIKEFLGAGSAIGSALTLFGGNLWTIAKVVLVIYAPFEIFKYLSIGSSAGPAWQQALGLGLLWGFCSVLTGPAVILALMAEIHGTPAPSLSDLYRAVLSRLPLVIPSVLLSGLCFALGVLCLVIPGIILGLAFTVLYPVATLENGSTIETLKRCWRLTDGSKGRIFFACLGMGILQSIISGVVGLPLLLVSFSSGAWFIAALSDMAGDIISMLSVVLSLVIYLGILKLREPFAAPVN